MILPNGDSPGYSSLSLSGSCSKTMPPSELNIYGDFSLSGSATTIAAAVMKIGGNLNIETGSAFITGNYDHIVGGNLTNNGTFTASPGNTITMNGASVQSISGSATTNFYNFVIDNSQGVSLFANVNVNNDLTLTTNNLTVGSRSYLQWHRRNSESIQSGRQSLFFVC